MPPTHPSQADVAAAYRTLIAHETEPKEQDFYRTRLQRLEQATESVCEFDCCGRVAAAGVGVYCPECSAKCAETDLATELAKAIRAAWVDRLDWDELAQGALEFLTSAGRLIPAGGMALTAEQVEDVKIVLGQLERGGPAFEAAHERLRALFPATEPGEAPCTICNVNETNHAGVSYYHPFTTELGPFDDDGNDRPAPAEPTEEETKAEGLSNVELSCLKLICDLCHKSCRGTVWLPVNDMVQGFVDRHYLTRDENGFCKPTTSAEKALASSPVVEEETKAEVWDAGFEAGYDHAGCEHTPSGISIDPPLNPYDERNGWQKPASSPVVPAATETEWPTADDVPDDVKFVSKGNEGWHSIWMRCGKGSTDYADLNNPKVHEPMGYQIWHVSAVNDLAPFVAAEEG